MVADILRRSQNAEGDLYPVGILDDNESLLGTEILGLPILGRIQCIDQFEHDAIIACVGDNRERSRIFDWARRGGRRFVHAIHPSAVIGNGVAIGEGVTICAGVIVGTGTTIGDNVILNTGCSVDHHNHIGSHAHIGPGARLGGTITVRQGAFVGVGAAVIPGLSIGAWSIVGAGSVVTQDVPPKAMVYGNPAREHGLG